MLTNAPYLLNLDCDHYINNSKALREAMCFMMDPLLGKKVCYVQFPQRFDGIDRHDRYANRNIVFFDVSIPSMIATMNFLIPFKFWLNKNCVECQLADQHERSGWNSRAYLCRDWVCFQETGALWR